MEMNISEYFSLLELEQDPGRNLPKPQDSAPGSAYVGQDARVYRV